MRSCSWELRPVRLAAAACLLACVTVGCGHSAAKSEEETHAAPVKAEQVRRETLEEWTDLVPGASQPLIGHAAQVSARVDGQVVEVLPDIKGQPVAEGQEVAAGQVIVRLDDRIAQANVAKLDAAVKELEEVQKQAELAIEQAKIDVDRLETLRPMGMKEESLALASRIELTKARLALKDAEAKQKATVAKQQSAWADLNVAQVQLSMYTLKSPIAGRLGLVNARPGQTLAPGMVVAEVVSLAEIDILCQAAGEVARRLQVDQPARIPGQGDPEAWPQGKVVFVAVQGQPDTGCFPVKVRLPNEKLRLGANAVVPVQVRTAIKAKALVIPAVALSADQRPPTVLLVIEEKEEGKEILKAQKLEAEVGIRAHVKGQDLVELLGLHDPKTEKDVPLRDDMKFVVEGGNGLETGDLLGLMKEEHDKEEHGKEEHLKQEPAKEK